jgi:hypothetical protein
MTLLVPGHWYATRERVKAALDVAETARSNTQIDNALATGTDSVDGLCKRTFSLWTGARTFDWPERMSPTSWRLWFEEMDLISATSITAAQGDVTLSSSDYILRPDTGPFTGPPFTHLELLLSTDAAFGGGDTWQRDITITGLWGYRNDSKTAGTLTSAVNASTTSWAVSDSNAAGVGDLLAVDSERVVVTGKSMADTTRTVGGSGLAASMAGQVLTPSGGTWVEGEVLLIDAERLLVVDVAGSNVIVKRAWDGSTLAAHTAGTAIYAPRALTVTRGAAGTTAASHSSSATITRHDPPALAQSLALGEALATLLGERSGYVGQKGSQSASSNLEGQARLDYGAGLPGLRVQCRQLHGRKARMQAV